MKKIIDTHAHPYLNKEKNEEKIIADFFQNWWVNLIVVWTNIETSKKSITLAKNNPWVYSLIWIHPCEIDFSKDIKTLENNLELFLDLEKLYLENKDYIVWIWECWLDYYRIDKENFEKESKIQEFYFKAQIEIAKKYNLPVIIHNRDSKENILRILKETWYKNFIFHCYSENLDYAKKLLEFSDNCMISFSWIVTFKNAADIQETAKNIPLKNILIETDSPYLTPAPYRGKEENEPLFTKYILEKIIELREESPEEIENQILNNSIKTFKLF